MKPFSTQACQSDRYFTLDNIYKILLLNGFLFLSACSAGPPLNSERITERYGNYAVEVVRSDGERRISRLYSVDAGVATTRTLAIVHFEATRDPAIEGLTPSGRVRRIRGLRAGHRGYPPGQVPTGGRDGRDP